MLTHFGAASLKRHVRDVRFRAQQTHVIQTGDCYSGTHSYKKDMRTEANRLASLTW